MSRKKYKIAILILMIAQFVIIIACKGNESMKIELTPVEKQATMDAIKRFQTKDKNLINTYDIEFIITNAKENNIPKFEEFLKQIKLKYKSMNFKNSDLITTIQMKMIYEKIIEIESFLTFFAVENGLKYDGWGAFE